MTRLAALLRAVNVGGRKVVMADLRRVVATAFDDPQTLLTSGNLIVRSRLTADETARRLEALILVELHVATDVLVRDREALAQVLALNPLMAAAEARPASMAVLFLSAAPAADLSRLDSACTQGEQVRAGPDCLYLDYPAGQGRSRLTLSLIERKLGVRGTARNWNTVRKLHAALG